MKKVKTIRNELNEEQSETPQSGTKLICNYIQEIYNRLDFNLDFLNEHLKTDNVEEDDKATIKTQQHIISNEDPEDMDGNSGEDGSDQGD